jgi:hypothetical protein
MKIILNTFAGTFVSTMTFSCPILNFVAQFHTRFEHNTVRFFGPDVSRAQWRQPSARPQTGARRGIGPFEAR